MVATYLLLHDVCYTMSVTRCCYTMSVTRWQPRTSKPAMNPTKEQKAVIRHEGGHARVLAVAGSGKTTTMALRIKHLIEDRGVAPRRIRVLMFNRLANRQFQDRLTSLGITGRQAPLVSTFHSFAYQFVQKAITDGHLPAQEFWTGRQEERVRLLVLRTIQDLVKAKKIPEHSVDVETAIEAIALWKGALIPPNRAGHRSNTYLPAVYRRYERSRKACDALAYDDFIPSVLDLLSKTAALRTQWCGRAEHLIVDEYQDVNLCQQTLIERLAGSEAEVMVVGDDDQTIYEWRGARPAYILRDFETVFHGKAHATYKLTRSFRFGPGIAKYAFNTIALNRRRHKKKLVAYDRKKKSDVMLIETTDASSEAEHHAMALEVKRLIDACNVPPAEIWVLGRLYAQLSIFESQCLATGIPYRVLGAEPFFRRSEVQKLLDYLRVVLAYEAPLTASLSKAFLNIANAPNRKLQRALLIDALEAARRRGLSIKYFMQALVDEGDRNLSLKRLKAVRDLQWVLEKAHSYTKGRGGKKQRALKNAGRLLKWIALKVDYEAHFRDYYGEGEDAFERMESLRNFTDFAQSLNLESAEFLKHMETLDSTQGARPEQLITMTTIHKTKGLEFDYVFIPSCQEGYMPCLYESEVEIYDRKGLVEPLDATHPIESERRLFYVALTRARKGVYIGVKHPEVADDASSSGVSLPSRFIKEMQGM